MPLGYVTLEEANKYVETHYLETDDARLRWEDLEDESKEVLLVRSFEGIDSLPFPGRKTYPSQEECFPRYPSTEVPLRIKYAQIENALALSEDSYDAESSFYERLQRYGIQSYSIGNLSETFGSVVSGGSSDVITFSSVGIVSNRAKQYLLPYLRGGYKI